MATTASSELPTPSRIPMMVRHKTTPRRRCPTQRARARTQPVETRRHLTDDDEQTHNDAGHGLTHGKPKPPSNKPDQVPDCLHRGSPQCRRGDAPVSSGSRSGAPALAVAWATVTIGKPPGPT